MRWITCFVLATFCLYADTPPTSSENDIQTRINKLQEEIAVHQNRARFAEREAMRLMTLDLSSYRRYLMMQQKNEEMAEEFQRELDRLQGSRKNQ